MSKIVIVGGGAAGLLCAAKSAEKGNDVVIIEKMSRCGRKLMITGKGRCNVTNASFELDDLISNVPTNPRFLYSAFSNFFVITIKFCRGATSHSSCERNGQGPYPRNFR